MVGVLTIMWKDITWMSLGIWDWRVGGRNGWIRVLRMKKGTAIDDVLLFMPVKAFLCGRILDNGTEYSALNDRSLPPSLVVFFLYSSKLLIRKMKEQGNAHHVVKGSICMSQSRWQTEFGLGRTSEQEATWYERLNCYSPNICSHFSPPALPYWLWVCPKSMCFQNRKENYKRHG